MYVLKLVLSSPLLQSPFLFCHEQFGWHTLDEQTKITWDRGGTVSGEESEDDLDSADGTDIESSDCEQETVPTIATSSISEDHEEA